ncbi:MAG: hypothetical protein RL662_1179 [Bacteroidota bacterium]|jgi:outer membrane protein TolC
MNNNKYLLTKLLILILCFSIFPVLKAQKLDSLMSVGQIDYENIDLPPLQILFENAKSSATVKYYGARKEAEKSMLKTVTNQWLKYFKIVGAYQYGIMGTTSNFTDQGQVDNPVVNQLSNSKQTWYNIGLAVSIPFDELLDRGNKIRRQKMEMKATEAEVERWHDEQKIRIVESYSNAKLFLSLLKIKSEAMIIANAQYRIAESDFVNGRIRPADLSARKGVQTDAIVNYEEAKSQLMMALLQLEILAKTKIIND